MKWLLLPVAGYIALCAVMFFAQRSLLYLPSQRAVADATLETAGLVRWPNATRARGYLYEPDDAEATVVVFHGNAGQAIDRRYYLEAIGGWRARVILAEYPGYGERAGSPSEAAFVDDARETLRLASERFPNTPLLVIGELLGAAVAAAAVGSDDFRAPEPEVDALALLTPWNTLTALASHHYRFLPVRWLLRDRWDTERRLANFDGPVAVVLAERDEVVPARFGRALFEALPSPKTRFVVEGADHNDWFDRVDESWWRELYAALEPRIGPGT